MHPFQFFCSFSDPKLIEDVRSGRRREFEAFHANGGDFPDPQAKTTFAASRLTWSWESDQHKSGLRRLNQDLLRTRHEWPALRDYSQRSARMLPETQSGVILELIRGGRRPDAGGTIHAFFNLTAHRRLSPSRILPPCCGRRKQNAIMACDEPIWPRSVCCRMNVWSSIPPVILNRRSGTQMPQEISRAC